VTPHLVVSLIAIGVPLVWTLYWLLSGSLADMWLHPLSGSLAAVAAAALASDGAARIASAGLLGPLVMLLLIGMALGLPLLEATWLGLGAVGTFRRDGDVLVPWRDRLLLGSVSAAMLASAACSFMLAAGWVR